MQKQGDGKRKNLEYLTNQGASRAAPGKSGLHARGEGERAPT